MKMKLLAIFGALAVLAFACGLDSWVDTTRNILSIGFQTSFQANAFYIGSGFANVFFAGALLLLVWFIVFKLGRNKLLASLFILLGLLATFSLVLYSALPSPFDQWPISPLPILAPTSHFSIAGAVVLLLGIWMFVPAHLVRFVSSWLNLQ